MSERDEKLNKQYEERVEIILTEFDKLLTERNIPHKRGDQKALWGKSMLYVGSTNDIYIRANHQSATKYSWHPTGEVGLELHRSCYAMDRRQTVHYKTPISYERVIAKIEAWLPNIDAALKRRADSDRRRDDNAAAEKSELANTTLAPGLRVSRQYGGKYRVDYEWWLTLDQLKALNYFIANFQEGSNVETSND